MQTIIAWADGTWCYTDEIGQFSWKSDDYCEIELPDHLDEHEIDSYIHSEHI